MAQLISGVVGEQSNGDGNNVTIRAGRQGDAIVSHLHGRYYEQALRGRLFYAQTALTGVAPGTALGTTGAFSLYNPIASGRNLVILEGAMGYVSGTLGAGVVNWAANTNPAAAATTGTAITPVNALLGGAASVAAPKTTSTLPTTPTAVRVMGNLQASLASTAVAPWQLRDDVGGSIIVTPGCTITLHATAAAGSSPLVVFSVLWEELPD